MKTFVALAAVLSAASFVAPASAGPNDAPASAPARAAPGDLGMAIMSAVVNADGTAARGEGLVSSAAAPSVGSYEVTFGRDVTACTHVIGTGLAGSSGTPPSGFAAVVGRVGAPAAIFVQTYDKNGDPVARGFHVVIYCGR